MYLSKIWSMGYGLGIMKFKGIGDKNVIFSYWNRRSFGNGYSSSGCNHDPACYDFCFSFMCTDLLLAIKVQMYRMRQSFSTEILSYPYRGSRLCRQRSILSTLPKDHILQIWYKRVALIYTADPHPDFSNCCCRKRRAVQPGYYWTRNSVSWVTLPDGRVGGN